MLLQSSVSALRQACSSVFGGARSLTVIRRQVTHSAPLLKREFYTRATRAHHTDGSACALLRPSGVIGSNSAWLLLRLKSFLD